MTEEEARKKWCPMVSFVCYDNRSGRKEKNDRCIASECMWWRWNKKLIGGNHEDGFKYKDEGYCGLAGRGE